MIYDVLASIGLMFILKYGTILNRYRTFVFKISILKELHQCSLCLGFWTGIAIASFELYFAGFDYRVVLLPLVSSGCCWVVDNINNMIQSIEIKIDRELDL
jgi:hypothetical protein